MTNDARTTSARTAARAAARRLSALSRGAAAPLALAAGAPLVGGLLLIAQAALMARALDGAISGGTTRADLAPVLLAIAGLIVARAGLGFVGDCAAAAAAETVKRRLRNDLFRRLLAGDAVAAADRRSGALASALVDQVEALDGFVARFLPAAVQAALLPLAFAAAAFAYDVTVGLLFLLTAPLIPAFMALVGWGAQAAGDAQAAALARLSGRFADRLRGLTTLRLFGRLEAEAAALEAATDELRVRTLRVLRIAFLSSAVLEFFAALGVAGVALYVGLSYLGLVDLRAAPLTLGAGLACLLLAPEVYQPLRLLAAHHHDRAAAIAAVQEIERQFGALATSDFTLAAPALVRCDDGPWAIEASALTLRTSDGVTILDRADLRASAGARIAVVGPSGAGKSTLLDALARLRPAEGTIRLGARALAGIPEARLRAGLGYVGQRSRLFHGTIADNIRLGDASASDDAVRRAADRAAALPFVERLPDGFETLVGEGGLGLSGGEAQRIALARLYLRDPAAILLDEPTAHLDAATERLVLDRLLTFARGRTMLVATHSATVADAMDGVLRFEAGRLAPCGPRQPRASLVKDAAA
ncbi:thiol reductant ABC exporter subunit CydD [Methylopila sp. Yamaguchi]|uniref:thiol reductant ABC exporter subunit CydD n=1 Tax=Methylopila sp. Yamaguchi TaxID=1437817 RepID=UPI000CBB9F4B|nr:thiol reductant ABC exporter subunit CydD [Methylopila sp. Yamaguchi]GBD47938.1 ABC transporter ATP-binding protein [Methylopila sp. Yamaguchi]